jgi:hypothetical protein
VGCVWFSEINFIPYALCISKLKAIMFFAAHFVYLHIISRIISYPLSSSPSAKVAAPPLRSTPHYFANKIQEVKLLF